MSVVEQWRRLHAHGNGWYWMIRGSRHGDLYHLCSLAAAFKDAHCEGAPLYLIADRASQAGVARLFEHEFAQIIVDDGMPEDRDATLRMFAEEGMPWFGPNVPIFLHPTMVLDPTRMTVPFAQANALTWMDLYKNVLHLPRSAEPAAPPVTLERVARARAFCKEAGIVGGKSVILFPFAQSLPVDAVDHFAALSRDFEAEGLQVFTSVAGDEPTVPGTLPARIPFELLIDVAEHAGRIVAVRSGICDVTATARCVKTFVYPSAAELEPWSVAALGFARDAHEVLFDFQRGSPAAFSEIVRTSPGFSALAAPPRHLTALVGAQQRLPRVESVALTDVLAGVALLDPDPVVPAAVVLHGVPPRDHARMGEAARQVLAALVRRYGAHATYYACRDNGLQDYFEEVDGTALAAGRYVVAPFWHSIVVTLDAPLVDFLPPMAQPKVLADVAADYDQPVRPADANGTPGGIAAAAGVRPLALPGAQFLVGWAKLDETGMWTDGPKAILKLVFATPPPAGGEVVLALLAGTSPSYLSMTMEVLVNGRSVATPVMTHLARPIDLPLSLDTDGTRRVFYLTFLFSGLPTAGERGAGSDPRRLGILLQGIARGEAAEVEAQRSEADGAG